MKIYLSTPVTSRPEKTYEEQYKAAEKRVAEMKEIFRTKHNGPEKVYSFVSFADIVPPWNCTEAEAMGRCIKAVIECDAILMDIGHDYSRGCSVELFTAITYGKKALCVTASNKIEAL